MKKLVFRLLSLLILAGWSAPLQAQNGNGACPDGQLIGQAHAELVQCLQLYQPNRCFELGSFVSADNDPATPYTYTVSFFYGPTGRDGCPRGILTRIVGEVYFDANCNIVSSSCFR